MPRPQIIKNPFYLLLSVAGFLFVVTVVAYWLMSLAVIKDPLGENPRDSLFSFLEAHGTSLLVGEVTALIVLSLAAMLTDDFWMRLWQRKDDQSPKEQTAEKQTPVEQTPEEQTTDQATHTKGTTPDESHSE